MSEGCRSCCRAPKELAMGWLRPNSFVVAVVLAASSALADRGAITIDAGGGLTALVLPAPFANPSKSVTSSAPTAWIGGRYALSNSLEVGASVFYEPSVNIFHNGVTVETRNGQFPGTLNHQLQRYGGLFGARYLRGMVFRFTAGLELGWSHRVYSGFRHIDDSNAANPVDYGLDLPAFTTDNVVIAPLAGVEWAAGDHWSISLLPRFELLVGPDMTYAFTVPLVVSWSWYR